MADTPSATLAKWGEHFEEELSRAVPEECGSLERSLSLVAAVEAVLALHVHAVIEDMPDPFHYCKTCSGHPAWPCPEVRAITAALTEEDADHG
jgi:hypothetical protein